MRVLYRSRHNDRLRVMLVLVHIDITPPHTPLPVFWRIGERTIPYSWRACIFDVKDAPRTGRPVDENVNKITEIIEVDRHVSSRSITPELKIDHKTVFSYLRKVGFKEVRCFGATPINTKKHDGLNFHLRRLGQTEGNRPIS
ncbi:uncharacterized protein TNCV_1605841 [Trichonephila clavipes]|nr:uncharacterized protein TNCV_1605841 [Trichonephila clavipes]